MILPNFGKIAPETATAAVYVIIHAEINEYIATINLYKKFDMCMVLDGGRELIVVKLNNINQNYCYVINFD